MLKAFAYMSLPIRTPADIGALIRAQRKAAGWDQATLAGKVGVSRLWVNQIEAGKPGANLSLVLKTLSVLGVTLTVSEPISSEPGLAGEGEPPPVSPVDIEGLLRAARGRRDG